MKFYWFIWIPRILLLMFALFLTIFSWDVFEGNESIWNKLLGLLIHNIPTYVFLLVLWFSWKRPFWGGYIILAIVILFNAFFLYFQHLEWFIFICGPLILCSILFFLAHYIRPKEKQPDEHESQTEPTQEV